MKITRCTPPHQRPRACAHTRCRGIVCWIGITLIGASGCSFSSWSLGQPEPAVERASLMMVGIAPSVMLSAAPAFHLITSRNRSDSPSRLLAVYTRVETVDEDTLRFTPNNVRFLLPDGTAGTVFDRPRAVELLHRAQLSARDLSYLDTEGQTHTPGGIDQAARRRLMTLLTDNLLDETFFDRTEPLEGYLIVDTLYPLRSLDGAVLEVIAERVGDAVWGHSTYQFPATPDDPRAPPRNETMDRTQRLEKTLRRSLSPRYLLIEDESAQHVGHPGAASGAGHFRVLIVAESFRGRDQLTRQRMVYAALGDAMQSSIHALALRTLTPDEWHAQEPGTRGQRSDSQDGN